MYQNGARGHFKMISGGDLGQFAKMGEGVRNNMKG